MIGCPTSDDPVGSKRGKYSAYSKVFNEVGCAKAVSVVVRCAGRGGADSPSGTRAKKQGGG